MKFSEVSTAYDRFEVLSGNALRDAVALFLKRVLAGDIVAVAYLTLGTIASEFDDINLGVADKMALRAIASTFDVEEDVVLKDYKKTGDIGTVAEARAIVKRPTLTVHDVFATLRRIAATGGSGSQDEKVRLFGTLLSKATPLEARYIARLAMGQLRLGVAAKTLLDGLAVSYGGGREVKKELEHAYNVCPDVGIIAQTLVTKGMKGIRAIGVMVGRPIQMMLCQRVDDIKQAFEKLGTPLIAEQKYDGERIQAHKNGLTITLFSRRLENITQQFPDVCDAIRNGVKAKTAILEGEVMAVKGRQLLPFQTLMTRRRKHDVASFVEKIPVKLFCFDVLLHNGRSLIDQSYATRRKLLLASVKDGARIGIAHSVEADRPSCAQQLFDDIVGRGGEGIVLKSLRPDSSYQAGVRGWHWIKWKPEYHAGMQDTFDLVVIGAYWGRGRRAGAYGGVLCAVYNKKKGVFESFCKLGSGFSDADLAMLEKKLTATATQPKGVIVLKPMIPDVWIAPTKVVEVLAAEITSSPFHAAGRTNKIDPTSKGLALRFPRFLRWRDDKKPEQATTTEEVVRMAKKR